MESIPSAVSYQVSKLYCQISRVSSLYTVHWFLGFCNLVLEYCVCVCVCAYYMYCTKHIHADMHLIYRHIWQKYYTCINNSKIFNFLTSSDLEVLLYAIYFCIANDIKKKIFGTSLPLPFCLLWMVITLTFKFLTENFIVNLLTANRRPIKGEIKYCYVLWNIQGKRNSLVSMNWGDSLVSFFSQHARCMHCIPC